MIRNPIASLTAAALTTGGLLLMGFFLRIGFMPDVDLAGSMALLFAAAIVGLATVSMLVVASVMPGVASRYLVDEVKLPMNASVLLAVAAPAGVFVTAIVLQPLVVAQPHRLGSWSMWALFGVGAVAAAAAHQRAFKVQAWKHSLGPMLRRMSSMAFGSLVWALGMLLVVQAALTVAADSVHPQWLTILFLVGWVSFNVLINVGMAHLPLRVSILVGPPAGLVSLVLLAMLTSSFSTTSAMTVKALGLGEMHGMNLVVSLDTCQAIGAMSGAMRCEPMPEKATSGVLRGVTILSRIGAQVVLEKRLLADPPSPPARLVLRKEAVLMWAPADVAKR